MSLFDVFFGTTQSQYSAYAILAAIVAICLTVLFSKTDMTYGNRFLLILFILLSQIPFIFLVLFEITCIVTGGNKDERWWCWLFAWVIAVFIIIYCILIIIISLSSLITYNNAIDKVDIVETKERMTIENSNDYAMQLMETSNKNIKELFTNSAEDEPEDLSSVIAQSTPMIKNPDMDNNKPVQSGGVVQLGEPEEFTNMRDRIQKFKDMRKNGGGDVKETFETTDTPLSMDELKKMEEEEIETFENKYFSPLLSDVNKPKRGGNDVESFVDSKKVFSSII
jgi:hypothetical protein